MKQARLEEVDLPSFDKIFSRYLDCNKLPFRRLEVRLIGYIYHYRKTLFSKRKSVKGDILPKVWEISLNAWYLENGIRPPK